MEHTTAHSDLHKRSSQAAQETCCLELAWLLPGRPSEVVVACVVLLPDRLGRPQRSGLRVALA